MTVRLNWYLVVAVVFFGWSVDAAVNHELFDMSLLLCCTCSWMSTTQVKS